MFEKPIVRFTENLSTLRDSVSLISELLEKHSSDFLAKHLVSFKEVLNEAFEKIPEDKKQSLRIGVSSDRPQCVHFVSGDSEVENHYEFFVENPTAAKSFSEFQRMMTNVLSRKTFLYQNSLISLASFVEWFISEFLKIHLERFPDAAELSKKTLTLKDLKSIGSIEDATKFLLDSKIDEILRDSFEGWRKLFKERLDLSMGYMDKDLPLLTEIFQRRNIIVHNGGRANAIYISKVAPKLREGISIDTELIVTQEYLEASIQVLELNMVLVCAELWKKVSPEDAKRGELLNALALEHIAKERWLVGTGISYFVFGDKGLPERHKLIAQLNYWQGLKWQGRYTEIKQEVERTDFSAKDERFQIGLLALSDDFDNFYRLLPKLYENGKLKAGELVSWPIFREIRKQTLYAQFREKYKNDFETAESQIES